MEFWQILLMIAGGLFAMFVVLVWLPHRIEVTIIGFKYGWPNEKRALIEKLFAGGSLTQVTYTGGSFNPDEEFVLLISGPFGSHLRRGFGDWLEPDDGSARLPPDVAKAFEGYIDRPSNVMFLLWYLPFLQALERITGRSADVQIAGPAPTALSIVVD